MHEHHKHMRWKKRKLRKNEINFLVAENNEKKKSDEKFLFCVFFSGWLEVEPLQENFRHLNSHKSRFL